MENKFKIGDIVQIYNPGRNYPLSEGVAKKMKARFYKRNRTILNNEYIWKNTKWIVNNYIKDLYREKMYLIFNKEQCIELIVGESGLKLSEKNDFSFFKDEDFLL